MYDQSPKTLFESCEEKKRKEKEPLFRLTYVQLSLVMINAIQMLYAIRLVYNINEFSRPLESI